MFIPNSDVISNAPSDSLLVKMVAWSLSLLSKMVLTIAVHVELLLGSLLLQVELPRLPILLQAEPAQPGKAEDGVDGVPLDLGLPQLLLLHLPA